MGICFPTQVVLQQKLCSPGSGRKEALPQGAEQWDGETWELAVSTGYSDIKEHLWPIEGSDNSDWKHCQERPCPKPPPNVTCSMWNAFQIEARLPLLSESCHIWKDKAKVDDKWEETNWREMRSPSWSFNAWGHWHLSPPLPSIAVSYLLVPVSLGQLGGWGGEASPLSFKLKRAVPPPHSKQPQTPLPRHMGYVCLNAAGAELVCVPSHQPLAEVWHR